ncbi:hypothetical protein GALMADRAFT_147640 [Galerina marginata CBS 339.88]|uniref:Uncharacterized protein n=1 Tax=Galerina marginata (strain CBS 339.88) TaxID=685588 RepID=A0A067SG93_GALM3|nr:hypothetical protein GALMADRAFT_147640 [Galerina marginata CBS 339.88]
MRLQEAFLKMPLAPPNGNLWAIACRMAYTSPCFITSESSSHRSYQAILALGLASKPIANAQMHLGYPNTSPQRVRNPHIHRTPSNFDKFLPAAVGHARYKASLSTTASSTSLSSAGYRLAGCTSVVDGVMRTDQGSGLRGCASHSAASSSACQLLSNLLMLDIGGV